MKRLTLEEIVAVEPGVADLLREARGQAYRRDELDGLYDEYKAKLSALAGWLSPHEELRHCHVYDIVIRALCDALEY